MDDVIIATTTSETNFLQIVERFLKIRLTDLTMGRTHKGLYNTYSQEALLKGGRISTETDEIPPHVVNLKI